MEVHKPVLVKEIIANVPLERVRVAIDATVGTGGHSLYFLEGTNIKLLGMDIDEESLEVAGRRLEIFKDRVKLIEANYIDINKVVERLGIKGVDFICADLGLSSFQLSCERRGFSFMIDAPLDMRFSKKIQKSAEDLVNSLSRYELESVFRNYGQEPMAKRIAAEIVRAREKGRIKTTQQLVEIVRAVKSRGGRKHDVATLVFQALRIAVNRELDNLQIFLGEAFKVLSGGGYLAVISYHSLEDRIVKNMFRLWSGVCRCGLGECKCEGEALVRLVTKKAIKPSRQEVIRNRRSRSARLRIIQKIAELRYPEYLEKIKPDRRLFDILGRRLGDDNKKSGCSLYSEQAI